MFSGDPDFCGDCGAILPLPDGKTDSHITCVVCKSKVPLTSLTGLTSVYTINFNTNIKSDAVEDEVETDGPLVDRTCCKCGHDKMTYMTLQLRSADEGQTVFYTCPKCKYKENENS